MISFAMLAGIIALLATLLGGLLALRFRKQVGLLAAFTAGVLVTVSLLEIVPESFRLADSAGIYPWIIIPMAMAGFLSLLILGNSSDNGKLKSPRPNNARNKGHLAVSEFIVHSFLEGVVIALGFQIDLAVGIVVAVAVIGHDTSDGLSVMTVAINRGYSPKSARMILMVDASAPVLGILATILVAIPGWMIALILPFIAGGFIYIGMIDLLPQSLHLNRRGTTISFTGAGVLLVILLSLLQ